MKEKTMIASLRRILSGVGIGLVILAGLPLPYTFAQTVPLPVTLEPIGSALAADDTDTAMLVKFVGPSTGMTTTMNSGTVAVAVTTSDFTFLSGAAGSEAADTSLECPVSGALGGIIDVSNAACNTAGEICDIINAPTSNFRCILLDSLRSDVLDARLVTKSAATANSAAGTTILWDTSTAFDVTQALTPWRSFSDYVVSPTSRAIKPNKYDTTRTAVLSANATSTYGSGTSNFRIYSVDVEFNPVTGKGTETVTNMHNYAGGATTVNAVFAIPSIGVYSRRNEKLVLRLDNSAAMSAISFGAYGFMQRFQ